MLPKMLLETRLTRPSTTSVYLPRPIMCSRYSNRETGKSWGLQTVQVNVHFSRSYDHRHDLACIGQAWWIGGLDYWLGFALKDNIGDTRTTVHKKCTFFVVDTIFHWSLTPLLPTWFINHFLYCSMIYSNIAPAMSTFSRPRFPPWFFSSVGQSQIRFEQLSCRTHQGASRFWDLV